MATINIYANYGVLAAEKRIVYTYGAEHAHATCSDKLTVEIPSGWELLEASLGEVVKSPWGWNYEINEVLGGNKYPHFIAKDKDMNTRRFKLKEIEA